MWLITSFSKPKFHPMYQRNVSTDLRISWYVYMWHMKENVITWKQEPHSVEIPSMVDSQWNMLHWRPKCKPKWRPKCKFLGTQYQHRFFIHVKNIIWRTHKKSYENSMYVYNLNGVCMTDIDSVGNLFYARISSVVFWRPLGSDL